MSTEVRYNNGIGFFGLLTIVFIALKLMGYIDWSWVWVVSPLWIPIAIVIGIILLMFIVAIAVVITMELVKIGRKIF